MSNPTAQDHMLTPADELLLHQGTRPLSIAAVSDHRHFDRHWFGVAEPGADLALIMGMGCYKNMNVMDGFLTVHRVADGRQFNLRGSRILRPDAASLRVGPIAIEIVEPFRKIRLAVDSKDHGIGCDLLWEARFPPHLEDNHVTWAGGTVVSDSTRYDQIAVVNGWVDVDGRRTDARNWWSVRDHCWGVRPGVGGFEPVRAEDTPINGRQFHWSCFSTADISCQFQMHLDATGVTHQDGSLHYLDDSGRPSLRVQTIEADVDFTPAKLYTQARYRLGLSNGESLGFEATPIIPAWAYSGTGYDGGYFDKKGLGANRGDGVLEYDVFNNSDPANVRDLSGQSIGPGHREQPARVRVNGDQVGVGHCCVMVA